MKVKEVIFNEKFLHLKKYCENIEKDFQATLDDMVKPFAGDKAFLTFRKKINQLVELKVFDGKSGGKGYYKKQFNNLEIILSIIDWVDGYYQKICFNLVIQHATNPNLVVKFFYVVDNNWEKAYLELLDYCRKQKLI